MENQVEAADVQTTYAASLLTEFAQRRHVDVTPILKDLRMQEMEVLQFVQEIRYARRRGRDRSPVALETLDEKTTRLLDSLNALEEPVRTLALRDPTASSYGAAVKQIRATVHRAALRVFVEHSRGLPFARRFLQRMWDDARGYGCVGKPDSDVLGMMVKKFRGAEDEGMVWRLKEQEKETTHAAAFQMFLGSVLSELKDLREDIFTLIMDIHIDSGMSVESLKNLVNKCMRFSQSEWNGRWTPAAYHALMQAFRRDGDIRGCMDTYRSYRETLAKAVGDDAWNRRNFSTASWPYEAVLTACLEARVGGIRKDRYRPPRDMPEVVWRDIQHDGVVPPPRLLAYLIKLAVQGKDVQAAHRLWGIFFPASTPENGHRLIARPDMDCYAQYFKLLRQQPAAGGDIVPLRPVVKQMLDSRVTAGQKLSAVRAVWTQVLETSLRAPYYDLPLALWILGRFDGNPSNTENRESDGDSTGFPIDALVIDTAASRLINYWKSKPRGTHWTRQVMGSEGLALYLERDRGGPGSGSRMPLGLRARNARSRGATIKDWDMLSRRLEALAGKVGGQEGEVYLPLAKPFARWDTPENAAKVFQTRVFRSSSSNTTEGQYKHPSTSPAQTIVLQRFQRGLIRMLELCIAAKPGLGVNVWIEQAKEVLLLRGETVCVGEQVVSVAMQDVRRDLFGS
ncbi:hypothetical protein QFC22_006125 [Naganishia vaughanmartiniae]|uniref:Uncharacterized protein n=1 Tax=Naganishia vaughanmartiniae TaxID=1424756 RepID=A0ACC2WPA8_9TREE|nr:hypothetical protein QFC22_006125 [Naganishia vaughanmartiniae]